MTRKDYIALAGVLQQSKPEDSPLGSNDYVATAKTAQWLKDVNAVAAALRRDNNAFDEDRFMKACGIIVS